MKRKKSIIGIVLSLVLVTSLMLAALPVAANPGTLVWDQAYPPLVTYNQVVVGGGGVSHIAVASDGTMFAVSNSKQRLETEGTATAGWSTVQTDTGSTYSAMLTCTGSGTSHWSAAKVTYGETLATFVNHTKAAGSYTVLDVKFRTWATSDPVTYAMLWIDEDADGTVDTRLTGGFDVNAAGTPGSPPSTSKATWVDAYKTIVATWQLRDYDDGVVSTYTGTNANAIDSLPGYLADGGVNAIVEYVGVGYAGNTDPAYVDDIVIGGMTYPGTPCISKSVDGGLTWTASSTAFSAAIVALEVSPQYASDNTVFAATATQVYRSTTGGAAFTALGAAAGVATHPITCLALSPTYETDGQVMVGCADRTTAKSAAVTSNVKIWGTATGGMTWAEQGALTDDVTAVAFSPSYPHDTTILAVASNTSHARLNTKVGAAAWNSVTGFPVNIVAIGDPDFVTPADLQESSIALPSDYDFSNPYLRRVYVGVADIAGTLSDVFRVDNVTAGVDLNVTAGAGNDIASLVYSGDYTTGTLFAGNYNDAAGAAAQVFRCANPTALTPIWYPASKAPTGTTAAIGPVCDVALDADFATNNKVYAATMGNGSAVSVSNDGGINFEQYGLIDVDINSIQDIAPSPAYSTDSTMFMVTNNFAGNLASLWKTTDGAASWIRANTLVSAVATAGVRLSPDFATDSTLYFVELGAGATNLTYSVDGGTNFTASAICPVAIADLMVDVDDSSTIYVANNAAGTVAKSINKGWTWPAAAIATVGALPLRNLAQAPNGDILVGDSAGGISRSTDYGVIYLPVGVGIGGDDTMVAFDANYATNHTVYAGASSGNTTAGIWRFVIGTSSVWLQIENEIGAGDVRGILVASDGTMYAADFTGATTDAGGVRRTLDPTFSILLEVNWGFEWVTIGDGLTANVALDGISMSEGSNMLVAWAGANIYTFTDTLSAVSPALVSPAAGEALITSTSVTLEWGAVTGATEYEWAINPRSDFLAGDTATAFSAAPVVSDTAAVLAGLTYYWHVRASQPVEGPWSETRSFSTQLSGGINAPAIQSPSVNGVGPGGTNAPLQPVFQWAALKWATHYELELAMNPGFTGATQKTVAGTVWQADTPLAYSTTYYWRVRAASATTTTDWSEAAFTTMAEPVVEEVVVPVAVSTCGICGLTFDSDAALEAHIAATHAPVTPTTPGYLWAVIVIGAVLIISVIVLIVRTRRAI